MDRELSSGLCDDLKGYRGGGGREVQEGEEVCTHRVDSLHCTASTNKIL